MGGSRHRIQNVAKFIQHELRDHLKEAEKEPYNLSKSDRYEMYKVGPVLAVNVSKSCQRSLCCA